MLPKEKWLPIAAMELDFDINCESIQILAIEVKQLLPEANKMNWGEGYPRRWI